MDDLMQLVLIKVGKQTKLYMAPSGFCSVGDLVTVDNRTDMYEVIAVYTSYTDLNRDDTGALLLKATGTELPLKRVLYRWERHEPNYTEYDQQETEVTE